MDVPEEQLRLLHVGLLLRRRGPSRAAGWSAGDRELLLGQVEPAVVLEAELLFDGLKGRENSIQLATLNCKSESKITGYLRDERLSDARLDGEQEVEPGPVDAVVLDGGDLQQEAGHVKDLILLFLTLVRDADRNL